MWWSTIALEGWANLPGARYSQIAEAVRNAARHRLIVPGQRVPAERVLADLVGVSRGTVVRAFDELVTEGLLERIQGSGTYVRTRRTAGVSRHNALGASDDDVLDLSMAGPASPDELPAYDPVFTPSVLSAGGHPAGGIPALRRALAHFMSDTLAVPTDADQIFVTNGGPQSLELAWAGLALTGRNVFVACPTWPDAVTVVGQSARRVIPVRTDQFGVDIAGLQRLTRKAAPDSALLVSPTTGPTGVGLVQSRRHRLAQSLEHGAVLAVEDASDTAYLRAPDGDGGPLAALSEHVVTVGHLDQVLWSGLGIGWLRIPEPLSARFRMPEYFRGPGVGVQLLAARALTAADSDWFAGLRTRTASRRGRLIDLLRDALPPWVPQSQGHGAGIWVRLPVPEAITFAHTARRFGVAIGVGARYCVEGQHHDSIWLSAGHDDGVLDLAVDRLSAAWHEYTHRVAATV
ncbi:GntR family transcriptional regulator [Mycobacterium sp. shizuoka-1]|nr:GntR family transcriptional regulator [Mycobacterium sp. shizuoka-1]